MQLTFALASAIVAAATGASAGLVQRAGVPEGFSIQLAGYRGADSKCETSELVRSYGIPNGPQAGECLSFTEETTTVGITVPANATGKCFVSLYDDVDCKSFNRGITVGPDTRLCSRPDSGTWHAVLLNCPAN